MRIGFYSPHMCGFRGGAERLTLGLCHFLMGRGHSCEMYFPVFPPMTPKYRIDPAIAVHAINPATDLKPLRNVASRLDVAVLQYGGAHTALMLRLFNDLDVPLIVAEQLAPEAVDSVCGHAGDRLAFLTAADKIVLLSERYLHSLPGFLRSRALAIPNPVSELHPIDWRREQSSSKTLLAVGRLDEFSKRFSVLIEAFSRLAESFPDWNLRICGEGPSRKDYEALIAGYGLEGRITLCGIINDIDAEYAGASLLCMPSATEGCPNALLEAQSHGLPAVGFLQCTGVNEILLDGENGLLAPRMTAECLAESLAKLMASGELRRKFSLRSHELCSRYDREKLFGLWEKTLYDVTERTDRTRLHVPPMTEEDVLAHRLALLVAGETEKERMRGHIQNSLPRIRDLFRQKGRASKPGATACA